MGVPPTLDRGLPEQLDAVYRREGEELSKVLQAPGLLRRTAYRGWW